MIVRFLKWALSKFEPKPTLKEQLTAWPFPSEEAIAKAEAVKKKPAVKKATTRTKKPVVAAKTTRTKKAK